MKNTFWVASMDSNGMAVSKTQNKPGSHSAIKKPQASTVIRIAVSPRLPRNQSHLAARQHRLSAGTQRQGSISALAERGGGEPPGRAAPARRVVQRRSHPTREGAGLAVETYALAGAGCGCRERAESGRTSITGWTTAVRRVGVWRGGFRLSVSVCRPFRLAVP
jgi:hypothetical protein